MAYNGAHDGNTVNYAQYPNGNNHNANGQNFYGQQGPNLGYPPEKPKKKGKVVIILLVCLVLCAAIGGIGYLVYTILNDEDGESSSTSKEDVISHAPTEDDDVAPPDSLALSAAPIRNSYRVGEKLDTAGLTLTAVYGEDRITVNHGFTCTPATLDEVGIQTITVSYGGKTVTFTVDVKAAISHSGSYGNLSWLIDTEGELVVSGSGEMVSFAPNSDSAWLEYKDEIKRVIIEDGVTVISDYAFYDCAYIEEAIICDTVTIINSSAFEACTALNDLSLPDTIFEIDTRAFFGCSSLTAVKLPDSIVIVGDGAFACCSKLKSITVDSSNVDIASKDGVLYKKGSNYIICYPAGKTDSSFTVPDGTVIISGYAFAGCDNLTEITMPDSVIYLGKYAFAYCDRLTSIYLPGKLGNIDAFAFADSPNLSLISFDGTKSIWENEVDKDNEWKDGAADFTVSTK